MNANGANGANRAIKSVPESAFIDARRPSWRNAITPAVDPLRWLYAIGRDPVLRESFLVFMDQRDAMQVEAFGAVENVADVRRVRGVRDELAEIVWRFQAILRDIDNE